MTCDNVKDELLIGFGRESLPEVLMRHLEQCDDCRGFWEELTQLSGALPENDAFELEEWELDAAMARLDRAIDRRPLPWPARLQVTLSRWLGSLAEVRSIPAAVAVVLVLALTLSTTRFEQMPENTELLASLLADTTVVMDEDDVEDPDDMTVEALLAEYTSLWRTGSAELLLDDITEDEYEYLAKSLNVGDFL